MVTYFTSSKHVKAFIEQHGMPDIIQVRKTFSDRNVARLWEHKVLKRMNAVVDDRFLNRTNNRSIHPEDAMRGCKRPKPGQNTPERREASRERIKLYRAKMQAGMTPEKIKARALKSGATRHAAHLGKLEQRSNFQKTQSASTKEVWKTRTPNVKENSTGRFPTRAVTVDGVVFASLTEAAAVHGIHVKSAYNRVRKDAWPTWSYDQLRN